MAGKVSVSAVHAHAVAVVGDSLDVVVEPVDLQTPGVLCAECCAAGLATHRQLGFGVAVKSTAELPDRILQNTARSGLTLIECQAHLAHRSFFGVARTGGLAADQAQITGLSLTTAGSIEEIAGRGAQADLGAGNAIVPNVVEKAGKHAADLADATVHVLLDIAPTDLGTGTSEAKRRAYAVVKASIRPGAGQTRYALATERNHPVRNTSRARQTFRLGRLDEDRTLLPCTASGVLKGSALGTSRAGIGSIARRRAATAGHERWRGEQKCEQSAVAQFSGEACQYSRSVHKPVSYTTRLACALLPVG